MINKQISKYLEQWDVSFSISHGRKRLDDESRRKFLKQLTLGVSAYAFSQSVLANKLLLTSATWKTFEELHLHLFPIENDTPNGHSINATAYLKSVIEWPGVDEQDKKFMLDGVGWLNGVSVKQFNREFYDLTSPQREKVLRLVEKSKAGENWLSMVLLYLMEALLTDPVYGANTNGTGWKWLEHQPGYPLPSDDKRYFNL